MASNTPNFDWNQAHAFLATAEEGSFTSAARRLGVTQPTLGRQVASLEASLGVTLFERTSRGPMLTEAGLELVEHVRAMRGAADLVALAATGQAQAIEGHVTISATDLMSLMHLPAALEMLRATAPGIDVEIVAANTLSDLRRREADIAIRHVRPEQPELIARLIRQSHARFYAATSFLDRHGRPRTIADLAAMDFVGFEGVDRMVTYLHGLGLPVSRRNFRISSSSGIVAWDLVRRGFGVGVMIEETANLTPGVESILPEIPPIPVPVWLVTHRELRSSRRIRVVFDTLAEELSRDTAR